MKDVYMLDMLGIAKLVLELVLELELELEQKMVAVELKIGRFKPEYVGKMNFYLNLLDDFVREPGETHL